MPRFPVLNLDNILEPTSSINGMSYKDSNTEQRMEMKENEGKTIKNDWSLYSFQRDGPQFHNRRK